MRLRRAKGPVGVYVHDNDGRIRIYATAESAVRAAEEHAAGWSSPASIVPGEFEWRREEAGLIRLYLPHPTEPEPRRTHHTVSHLRVHP